MDKKMLHMVTFLLVVVSALNWGFIGFFDFNLVAVLFSFAPVLEKLVYVVIGVSAVYLLATHKEDCKICGKK